MLQPGKQVWRSSTEGEGQEEGQAHFPPQHTNGKDMRGTGMLFGPEGGWLTAGCVDEMEELSWPPSSLPGGHCRKCPVSKCRSPHPTDLWTLRNVHRSSLEGT